MQTLYTVYRPLSQNKLVPAVLREKTTTTKTRSSRPPNRLTDPKATTDISSHFLKTPPSHPSPLPPAPSSGVAAPSSLLVCLMELNGSTAIGVLSVTSSVKWTGWAFFSPGSFR